jgi:serine/threonine protein kinase
MSDLQTLAIGCRVADYGIERVLGAGGFGITYRAIDRSRQRVVAIKEYFPRAAAVRESSGMVEIAGTEFVDHYLWGLERFQEEAMTLSRFDHPNLPRVIQYLRAFGTAYIVLDYVAGPSLQEWLMVSRRKPSQEEIYGLAHGLLAAMEVVHRNDILHRDIAPKNILLTETGLPVLVDFGSARQLVGSKTMPLTALITPYYAPFEQYHASGQGQGPWTDIYAAAATLYQLVTGNPPPDAPSRVLADACISALTARRGGYRSSFLDAIDWGLEVYPRNRPQSVAEWRGRLIGDMTHAPRSGIRVADGRRGGARNALGRMKAAFFRH